MGKVSARGIDTSDGTAKFSFPHPWIELCGMLSLARVVQRGRWRSMAADVFVVGCVGGSHQEHHRLFCSLASPWERLPCGEQQVLQELGAFACHVSDFRISNHPGHIKQASLAHICAPGVLMPVVCVSSTHQAQLPASMLSAWYAPATR